MALRDCYNAFVVRLRFLCDSYNDSVRGLN